MEVRYAITSEPGPDDKVSVRRLSDGKVSRCKPSWLVPAAEGVYVAKNNTKAIRLDGLTWETEVKE